MTRHRSPSSTSPPTARASWSGSSSAPTPPATATGTSTCTSATSAELGRGRRTTQRRPLQRHDQRRDQGLLHHPRPVAGDGDDESADLFRADVDAAEATVTRVSTGERHRRHRRLRSGWQQLQRRRLERRPGGARPTARWSASAAAAASPSGSGAAFFLSPELLDAAAEADGTEGEPNLYIAEPGSAPHFIATLEAGNLLVVARRQRGAQPVHGRLPDRPRRRHCGVRSTRRSPATQQRALEVYRHDSRRTRSTACPARSPTRRRRATRTSPCKGLSLTDDGRVFFTSTEGWSCATRTARRTPMSGAAPGRSAS